MANAQFRTNADRMEEELYFGPDDFVASWHVKNYGFVNVDNMPILQSMLNTAYEHGKRARSKEIRALI